MFPDWQSLGAPLHTPGKRDDIYLLKSGDAATSIPDFAVPKTIHKEGNNCSAPSVLQSLPKETKCWLVFLSKPTLELVKKLVAQRQ